MTTIKVWAAQKWDQSADENRLGPCKYSVEAIDRMGLVAVEGSEEEVLRHACWR